MNLIPAGAFLTFTFQTNFKTYLLLKYCKIWKLWEYFDFNVFFIHINIGRCPFHLKLIKQQNTEAAVRPKQLLWRLRPDKIFLLHNLQRLNNRLTSAPWSSLGLLIFDIYLILKSTKSSHPPDIRYRYVIKHNQPLITPFITVIN